MFNLNHIQDLLKGKLTRDGYAHFINVVSYYVRKHNWPRDIIVSDQASNSNFWSSDELKELSHQFFEWLIIKGKLEHLNKVPESYLPYYFLQTLISFVANKIKEQQKKAGLSFDKCRELVVELSVSDFVTQSIDGVEYVFNQEFKKENIKQSPEIDNDAKYVSKIPLSEKVKHFKPIVKIAIDDIFNAVESPVPIKKLVELTYNLFNQSAFHFNETDGSTAISELKEPLSRKHKTAVDKLLSGITKDEARLICEYLFQSQGETSLAELANKHAIPKSSLHKKIEHFRKKITSVYQPDNEEDGIIFIQALSLALDKIAK